MPMRKRKVVACFLLSVMAAEVARDAALIALCAAAPDDEIPAQCRDGGPSVAVLAAKIHALVVAWEGLKSLPDAVPFLQPQGGSQMEQLRRVPGL